jgi:integrase/recombinase XerC
MIVFRKDRSVYVVKEVINGKLKKRQAKTLELAEKIQLEMKKEASGRFRFDTACREYMKIHSAKKATSDSEKHFFYLLDIFLHQKGIEFLDEIKPKHLELLQLWLKQDHEFYSDRVRGHKAIKDSSVNRYFSSYGAFFSWCEKNEMILKNPCRLIDKLQIEKPEVALITDDEFRVFLLACPDWFKSIMSFAYLTGMRPSSIEKLKWKDIDFERSRIVYTTSKGAKGKTVEKCFPLLMPELIQLLNQYRASLIAKGLHLMVESYVFTGRDGKPIDAERISKVANRIFKKLGMKCTLYSLRHKLVSDLIKAGIGIEQAAQLVGHASIKTTQNYSHSLSMESLDKYLRAVRSAVPFGAEVAQKVGGAS